MRVGGKRRLTGVLSTVALATAGLALIGGGVLGPVNPAGASSEPPPVVVHNPHGRHLAVGRSTTFTASARLASTVEWAVKSPDGSTTATYAGTNTVTKGGLLKSSFTFGPVTASENGWEVAAVFVNDPTGVPSGIQETSTTPAVVAVRGIPKN